MTYRIIINGARTLVRIMGRGLQSAGYNMNNDKILVKHLEKLLDWQDAHASFDSAIEGISEEFRGVKPKGLPYSLWQLLEHLRLCQLDILDFCRNPVYKEPKFPDDLWPKK